MNVRCMKSKNIWLRFIASSFRTSMSYVSQLRAIIYCSNNSLLFVILMHGTRISNELYFLDEGQINFSYSTSANHYGSLTCVKYKNFFFAFSISNENSIFANYGTQNTESLFEIQYIAGIVTK